MSGVPNGVRDESRALGVAAVLALNVAMLLAGGSLTLIVQREPGW
jgi:hypothetical protein